MNGDDLSGRTDTIGARAIVILRAVVTLGVPSVIAMYVVYQITQIQQRALEAMRMESLIHAGEMRQEVGQTLLGLRELSESNLRTRVILRSICVELAKTQEQQRGCFELENRKP